jgi:hypothetical protein
MSTTRILFFCAAHYLQTIGRVAKLFSTKTYSIHRWVNLLSVDVYILIAFWSDPFN